MLRETGLISNRSHGNPQAFSDWLTFPRFSTTPAYRTSPLLLLPSASSTKSLISYSNVGRLMLVTLVPFFEISKLVKECHVLIFYSCNASPQTKDCITTAINRICIVPKIWYKSAHANHSSLKRIEKSARARTLSCKLARVPVSAFETICQAESRRKKAEKLDTRSKVARRRNVLRVSLPLSKGRAFFPPLPLAVRKTPEKRYGVSWTIPRKVSLAHYRAIHTYKFYGIVKPLP